MPRARGPINFLPYGIVPRDAAPLGDLLEETAGMGAAHAAAPKKKRNRPEDVFHVSVRKFLEIAIAPPGVLSRDRVIWFSIESRNSGHTRKNERTGKSYNIEGQIRKARGCIAGVPDVHVEWPGGSGWIELKAPGGAAKEGTTSDQQDKILDRLSQAGAVVAVARTLDEVEQALENWGVPFHARVAA